ncbi:MAG: YkgJ family cysteine cluster protein, partial [Treponema sp.]|nr:YkgJ family cysteine cluster protein [Treponema sp.]
MRFSCTRCSTCCRKESGFVYLSEKDLSRLAEKFKMGYTEFIKTWCRWVPFYRRRDRLSLREKSNFDCIFWGDSEKSAASDEGGGREGGCTVYSARPLQCRSF